MEFIMSASKNQLEKCVTTSIAVNGMTENCSQIIKYLVAWLDQHLQLHDHIVKNFRIDVLNSQEDQVLHPLLIQESAYTLIRS